MREEFFDELGNLAREDDRIVLLTADLGFSVIERFADEFPDRFVNVGVAEQNMIGLATGLAREGFIPFTYSIATFASMRPYELIRNGPALHNLPVRMAGAGGGVDYGHGGVTHFALEDVAILRAQPRLTVVVPADADQMRSAVRASRDVPGPIFFRVGRESRPISGLEGRFEIGQIAVLNRPHAMDVGIIASGPIAREAVGAANALAAEGIQAGVAVVSTFNPFPADDVLSFLEGAALAVALESHYRTGGLGSAVAEVMAEFPSSTRLVRAGVPEMPVGFSGSPSYMLEHYGLSADQLAKDIASKVGARR